MQVAYEENIAVSSIPTGSIAAMTPDNPEKIIGRLAGIDYGTRRIGLAISDPSQKFVSPAKVIPAAGHNPDDVRLVLQWAAQEQIAAFILGLPLNMDGSEGPQAARVRSFGRVLEEQSGRPVRYCDERLSSFAADQRLGGMDLSRGVRRRRQDAIAAQVILETYLSTRPD
jgi:putative Holliday junction resolvase